MATRAFPEPAPLDVLLAAIPSLPRPVLARLTARMVDRLDELDGNSDFEPDADAEDGNDAEHEQAGWSDDSDYLPVRWAA